MVEAKTGKAHLSDQQNTIYPQIESGDAIPRGKNAQKAGLVPGVPLKDQGYPNGVPVYLIRGKGVND